MRQLVETLLHYGPVGLFLLAALDSAGIPFPVAVDAAVTYFAAKDPRLAMPAAALAVAGSALGSLFLFRLGKKGGEFYLDKHAVTPRARRFRSWFQRYGLVTVFVPCLLPVPLPMKVFVISAGAFGVRQAAFLLVVVAARTPRYFGLAYLGLKLGEKGALEYFRAHGLQVALAGATAGALCLLLVKLAGRRRARHATEKG